MRFLLFYKELYASVGHFLEPYGDAVGENSHRNISECAEIRTVPSAVVLGLDSVFDQLVVEGLARQFQRLRGFGGVAGVVLERPDQ